MTAAALSTALVDELAAGRLPWHLLTDFPAEPAQQAATADQVVATAAALAEVGDRVEAERLLPADFFDGLHRHGLLTLQVDRADGGLGLSDYGTFRVLTAAAERCPAAGFALAVHNGIGLPALLPSVRPGALR
ncbi:MAG: acyl-CoA dehydrogenase family protein, partial [Actinobacteria bacterium]|nr:acyl-CoA dehydrogenase family protein [Actinomycetota bacterium]